MVSGSGWLTNPKNPGAQMQKCCADLSPVLEHPVPAPLALMCCQGLFPVGNVPPGLCRLSRHLVSGQLSLPCHCSGGTLSLRAELWGAVFTCVRVIQDCWFCLPHSEINRSFSIEIICLRKENNKWRDSKILGDCHERRFVPSLGLLSRVRKRTESTALKAQRNSANHQTSSFLFGFPLPKHWRL